MALDLPGHGEAPPASDYHYGSLVAHVLKAVTGIEWFALLGHSVGAAVAWLFAARYPARVTRLILVEPAAPHQSGSFTVRRQSRDIRIPMPARMRPWGRCGRSTPQ